MDNWITNVVEQFGYLGVFFMIALENVFPPIPSEVILTFGGMMTTFSDLTITGVVISATGGSLLGAVILYKIGNLLDLGRLEKIVDRWGHILRVSRADIYRANGWFEKYGYWTVFVCRFIPLIRSLISIPAGMARMNFWMFILLTTIGTFIWNVVLVSVGAAFGENWEKIVSFMDVYSNVAYVILGIGLIAFIVWFMKAKKRKN